MDFKFAILTPEFKEFLENYSPKDRMFTSYDEVKLIKKHINKQLSGKNDVESLQELRNSVVKFYSDLEKSNGDDIKYIPSMQSVTTVIDSIFFKEKF